MLDIKIHKFDEVIAAPEKRRVRNEAFQFEKMEIGKPWFIEGQNNKSLASRVYQASKKTGFKFSARTLNADEAQKLFGINQSGMGIWRIR